MTHTSPKWRWIVLIAAFTVVSVLLLVKGKRWLHPVKVWAKQEVGHAVARLSGSRWKKRLYTPTLLTKIGSLYFIVDCWHNRVIYSPDLTTPIERWRILDDDLAGPHSIVSDSTLYVVEDTGRNGIRVYTHHGDGFQLVQTVSALGSRTHRVRYDSATSAFYVLASDSQQLAKLIRHGERLQVVYLKKLPFLGGKYTRSFIILDGFMYFNSGLGHITKAKYLDDSYDVLDTYAVPLADSEMNDIFQSGKYLYITATPNAIIRTRSFEALRNGQFEDIYGTLGFKGTPYYLSEFDGRIFVPQITEYSGVRSFVDRDGTITDIRTLNDSGPPTWLDLQAYAALPK